MNLSILLIFTMCCLGQLAEAKPWVWEEANESPGSAKLPSEKHNQDKRPSPKRIGGKQESKPSAPPRNRTDPNKDVANKHISHSRRNHTKVFDSAIDSAKILNHSASRGASSTTSSPTFSAVEQSTVASTTPFNWEPDVDPSHCIVSGPSVFCIDIKNYPQEMISSILDASGSTLTDYFPPADLDASPSETDERTLALPEMPQSRKANVKPSFPQARNRVHSEQLCRSATIETPIKMARNTQGELLAIVNQEHIRQTITVERCLTENGQCQYARNFPAGYSATCKQKYTKHNLAALKNGKIQQDTFVFPSCCVCEVTQEHLPFSAEKLHVFPDEN